MDKKIRAISVAFIGSFFARISIPNYLIFSRFYLKNRTTTKPTPKSLFFNDFNARRGIATLNYNPMVNDGNYSVRFHKRERTVGQLLHARQRLSYGAMLDLILSQFYYNIRTFVRQVLLIKFCHNLKFWFKAFIVSATSSEKHNDRSFISSGTYAISIFTQT